MLIRGTNGAMAATTAERHASGAAIVSFNRDFERFGMPLVVPT